MSYQKDRSQREFFGEKRFNQQLVGRAKSRKPGKEKIKNKWSEKRYDGIMGMHGLLQRRIIGRELFLKQKS